MATQVAICPCRGCTSCAGIFVAEDYTQEIANLEAILNAGVQSASVDGLSSSYNLAEIRKRLAELQALQSPTALRRPRVLRISPGGAW